MPLLVGGSSLERSSETDGPTEGVKNIQPLLYQLIADD
jgi:hypothetical protein